jgi:excisionase family DNA binding protein
MTYGENDQRALLSVPEVAKMLHVSSKTINRLIDYGHGELPAVMVGSRWKVRTIDLKDYLKRQSGAFSNSQALEIVMSDNAEDSKGKGDILQLDVQKKSLELTATAFEVATRMITTFYPDIDVAKRAILIRTIIFDLLEATNIREVEQAILKISLDNGEQANGEMPIREETL